MFFLVDFTTSGEIVNVINMDLLFFFLCLSFSFPVSTFLNTVTNLCLLNTNCDTDITLGSFGLCSVLCNLWLNWIELKYGNMLWTTDVSLVALYEVLTSFLL